MKINDILSCTFTGITISFLFNLIDVVIFNYSIKNLKFLNKETWLNLFKGSITPTEKKNETKLYKNY